MAENKKHFRNVLVMRLSVLGNVAMTIPVLYPVCRANPDTRFIMLTKKWPATMFHDRPANLKVVDYDVNENHSGLFGLLKLAAHLHKLYDIDAVADLHNVTGTWVVDAYLMFKGAKVVRLDRENPKRKALVTHRTTEPVTPIHERYRWVFRELGFETPDDFTKLYDGRPLPVSPIVPRKEPGQRWIAISPFSSHRQKAYPLELMEQVIARLTEQENYFLFLMGGGKSEKIALRPIAKKYKNVISMAEVKHKFIDEYALLGNCDLMLTMESANMHLASLVDLQAMTIWGPTSPACGYLGYNQVVEDDIQLDMDCRPCSITGDKPCKFGDFRCLKNIDPDDIARRVIEAVEYNVKHQTRATKLAQTHNNQQSTHDDNQ
ncbi:MAG: glycosyltransferase family 9 protein [Muribaculaceae bacterium]|nr:glycosyltransferase family 9 protein [Muribaculaceae bacterium]